MQHGCGAALFPFANAIIEPQQMGEALWVLEGRPLALGALGERERKAQIRPPYPLSEGTGQVPHLSKEFLIQKS